MPVRSKGRLLAGLTVLGCLCWAGAGCQSAVPSDPFAIRPAGDAPAPAPTPGPAPPGFGAVPGAERPSRLATFWRSVTGRDGQTLPAAAPTGPTIVASSDDAFAIRQNGPSPQQRRLFNFGRTTQATPTATLTPVAPAPVVSQSVPVTSIATPGTIIATSGVASTWQPVRRVSAEETGPGLSGATQAFTPAPAAGQTPAELRVEGPLAIASSSGPPLSTDPAPKDNDRPENRTDKPTRKEEAATPTELPAPHAVVATNPAFAAGAPVLGPGPFGPPPVPRELAKRALSPYRIEPPDILLVESSMKIDQPIRGQHLVGVDGFVRLGRYGKVYVAGLTVEQARDAVAAQLKISIKDFDIRSLNVDVLAYNSKFYYVITDGGGYGEQVYRFSITGNETVLDALSQINGLPPVASKKKMWLARASEKGAGPPKILPIDWRGVTRCGTADTNYQLFPGDRIYVAADCWIHTDSFLAKRLSPIQRILGVTLLGASTVNAIRFHSTSGLGGISGFR